MKQILVIQTASIGDVILATAVVEKLHKTYPQADIDFLVKKGNEHLFANHPYIRNILVWDKKNNKTANLLKLLFTIRSMKYDFVANIQRFFSTGILTALSKATRTSGFDKNPMSKFFTYKYPHSIGQKDSIYLHETERNQQLISEITCGEAEKPCLYPSNEAYSKVLQYKNTPYICVAPASLWATKQYAKKDWCKFLPTLPFKYNIYLLGGNADYDLCEEISKHLANHYVRNLAGKLSLLESAALMRDAAMNYVCDSSPMHLATAVDAPTTAIFCSTIPEFGFGPLSTNSAVVETHEKLNCRPCGLHGHKECPKGTFECSHTIDIAELYNRCPE